MIPKIPLQRGIRKVNLQLIGEMFGGVEKVRIHKSRREYGLIVYVSDFCLWLFLDNESCGFFIENNLLGE